LLLGLVDEAHCHGARALEALSGHQEFAAHVQHLLGEVTTDPRRFDAASGEAHYRKALALAGPRGMRPLAAHCHPSLGKLYRRTGSHERAREHLTTATAMYSEMGMRFWLDQAEIELKRLP
jgi:hypothetical protein